MPKQMGQNVWAMGCEGAENVVLPGDFRGGPADLGAEAVRRVRPRRVKGLRPKRLRHQRR